MTKIERLLGEFIDAWQAGRRPDVATFIDRAAPRDRDKLAVQIEAWLEIAPTPALDAATKRSIDVEPALVSAREVLVEAQAPLAERLPALRKRAGLGIGDLAQDLVRLFGLDDEPRAAAYLEQIERDELDQRRLSRRLLHGLARILGVDEEQLAPVALAASGGALFRADPDQDAWTLAEIAVLSRAAFSPAPAEPLDELDRLFLGGPGA